MKKMLVLLSAAVLLPVAHAEEEITPKKICYMALTNANAAVREAGDSGRLADTKIYQRTMAPRPAKSAMEEDDYRLVQTTFRNVLDEADRLRQSGVTGEKLFQELVPACFRMVENR